MLQVKLEAPAACVLMLKMYMMPSVFSGKIHEFVTFFMHTI